MVSSPSAAAQALENEKRRKQTMEKVKANHLSRQLQMRLQYARLKVEHGWQKQNLNEVENLYFHNSHLRASKPFIPPAIITTQQLSAAFPVPQSIPAQSSLSFKLGTSSLGRSSMSANPFMGNNSSKNSPSQEDPTSNYATQATPVVDHPISTPNNAPPLRSSTPGVHLPMVVDSQAATSPPAVSTNPGTGGQNGSSCDAAQPSGDHLNFTKSVSPPQDSQSPVDNNPSSTNHYPTVKPPRPRTQKVSSGPRVLPSLTAKDMFSFGSTSTLTYDSFWSSNTRPTAPRPSRGSATTGLGEYAPVSFQIPGDFTSGIPDLARTTSSSSFVPSSTATLNLGQPRSLGGPT